MEKISIPYAAGAAVSALLFGTASTYTYAVAFLLPTVAAILLLTLFRRDSVPSYVLLYFLAGVFSHCCATLAADIAPVWSSPVSRIAASAAGRLKESIDALDLGDPERNALLKALLTGDRSGLTKELTATFRAAGASHILALSGLHIGIIYSILARITGLFGNGIMVARLRSGLLVSAAAFYTVMTGAAPSLVRAFLFILLSEIARNLPERKRDPARILHCALLIQLVMNPRAISDLGFQLSYLAVFGIVYIMPRLTTWYPTGPRFDPLKRIWDLCALSISCQCMTAPLVWLRFRSFPQYFLITNLLAMPITTAAIGTGLFCLATGTHCPSIALRACGQCVSLLVYVLEVIASL